MKNVGLRGIRRAGKLGLVAIGLGTLAAVSGQVASPAATSAPPVRPEGISNIRSGSPAVNDCYQGLDEARRGDLDGALVDFNRAIKLDPGYAPAWRYRGGVEQDLGDWAGALGDFNQTVALNPGDAGGWVDRGRVKRLRGDLAGALADYNQALELEPKYAPAYFHRGVAEADNSDFAAALADYARALELNPRYADVYRNRGIVKAGQGDTVGALKDMNTAIELNPLYPQGYDTRGFLHYDLRDFGDAHADFSMFCQLPPRLPQDYARFYLWLIQAGAGEPALATAGLRTYLQTRPAGQAGEWRLKIALFLTGELAESNLVAAADNADPKKNAGQHCEAWFYAGSKRLFAGDRATAVDYFARCLATQVKTFQEYQGAAAELKYLQATNEERLPGGVRPRTLNQARAGMLTEEEMYNQSIFSSITSQWRYLLKQGANSFVQTTALIAAKFRVHPDGRVSDLTLAGGTDPLITALCEQSISSLSPFPPWPDSMRSSVTPNGYRELSCTLSVNPAP